MRSTPLPRHNFFRAPIVAALTLCLVVAAAGSARAAHRMLPAKASVGELRSLADHYRRVTWEYQRAAHLRRTRTSFSYRRSSDRAYLRWTVASWKSRAYVAQRRAVASIHTRLAVKLPPPPAPVPRSTGRSPTPAGSRSASAGSIRGGFQVVRVGERRERSCDAASLAGAERRRGDRRDRARRAPGSDRNVAARGLHVHPPFRRPAGTRTPATATTAGCRWTGGSCSCTATSSSRVGARPTTGRSGPSSRWRRRRTPRDAVSHRGRTPRGPAA